MTMYVVNECWKRFMSKITIYPLVFNFQCILFYKKRYKGNYFQKKFMKLNIQLDIIPINLTPKHPVLSSGKHYEYFTISNFLKSMKLKY